MVVDLPAPFGPTKPVTWPGWTVNVIPSSACVEPNRLCSPSISMVASMRTKMPESGGSARRPAGTFAGWRDSHQAYARGQTTRRGTAVTIAARTMTPRAGGGHDHVGRTGVYRRPAGFRHPVAPHATHCPGRDA